LIDADEFDDEKGGKTGYRNQPGRTFTSHNLFNGTEMIAFPLTGWYRPQNRDGEGNGVTSDPPVTTRIMVKFNARCDEDAEESEFNFVSCR